MSSNNVALEKVRKQKEEIKNKLTGYEWFRGIGITYNNSDYIIKINVLTLTKEIKEIIFAITEYIPVYIEEVGDIIPQ